MADPEGDLTSAVSPDAGRASKMSTGNANTKEGGKEGRPREGRKAEGVKF